MPLQEQQNRVKMRLSASEPNLQQYGLMGSVKQVGSSSPRTKRPLGSDGTKLVNSERISSKDESLELESSQNDANRAAYPHLEQVGKTLRLISEQFVQNMGVKRAKRASHKWTLRLWIGSQTICLCANLMLIMLVNKLKSMKAFDYHETGSGHLY